MNGSKIHGDLTSRPLAKVAEVHRKYGTLAPHYAKVRAETAAEAGAPEDAAEWRQAKQELEIDDQSAAT